MKKQTKLTTEQEKQNGDVIFYPLGVVEDIPDLDQEIERAEQRAITNTLERVEKEVGEMDFDIENDDSVENESGEPVDLWNLVEISKVITVISTIKQELLGKD